MKVLQGATFGDRVFLREPAQNDKQLRWQFLRDAERIERIRLYGRRLDRRDVDFLSRLLALFLFLAGFLLLR